MVYSWLDIVCNTLTQILNMTSTVSRVSLLLATASRSNSVPLPFRWSISQLFAAGADCNVDNEHCCQLNRQLQVPTNSSAFILSLALIAALNAAGLDSTNLLMTLPRCRVHQVGIASDCSAWPTPTAAKRSSNLTPESAIALERACSSIDDPVIGEISSWPPWTLLPPNFIPVVFPCPKLAFYHNHLHYVSLVSLTVQIFDISPTMSSDI